LKDVIHCDEIVTFPVEFELAGDVGGEEAVEASAAGLM
jgi:hypothetical protein